MGKRTRSAQSGRVLFYAQTHAVPRCPAVVRQKGRRPPVQPAALPLGPGLRLAKGHRPVLCGQ